MILNGEQSQLEKNSVKSPTQKRYRVVLNLFAAWCVLWLASTTDPDSLLCAYLNELFSEGLHVSAVEYAFAAYRWAHPLYGRNGSMLMPRAIQALEGFRKLCPSLMRMPTSHLAMWALVGCLCIMGEPVMAVSLLLQWDLLLRPGELIRLTSKTLVAPAPLAEHMSH